jgi:serine protein kinase
VHLLYVLEQQIEQEQFETDVEEAYLAFIKEHLAPRYIDFIGKELQTAYLESYSEYGQNIFDRYVTYADFWIQDQEYRDPETGDILDRAAINEELEKIENLLPVISFSAKASTGDQKKHSEFVCRMVKRGYTEKQVRLLSEWYLRVRKSQ